MFIYRVCTLTKIDEDIEEMELQIVAKEDIIVDGELVLVKDAVIFEMGLNINSWEERETKEYWMDKLLFEQEEFIRWETI